MKVSEAIYCMKAGSERHSEVCEECPLYGQTGCDHCQNDAIDVAIQSLEMQDKLKQWIENYKNTEFKDVMITRDGLIDILEEFRLESEKPMKEVTVVMNVQVTKILKNVPDCFAEDKESFKKEMISEIKSAGYDDAVVEDVKVFERGETDARNTV